jgi:hypothetical protein
MAGPSDKPKEGSPDSTLVDDDTGPSTDMTPMTPETMVRPPSENTQPLLDANRLRHAMGAPPAPSRSEAPAVPWPEQFGSTQPHFDKPGELARALNQLQAPGGKPHADPHAAGLPPNPARTLVESETSVGPEPKPRVVREGDRPTGMRSNKGVAEPGADREVLGAAADPRTLRAPSQGGPGATSSGDSHPGSRVTLDGSDDSVDDSIGDLPIVQPPTSKSMTYADSPNAMERHPGRSGARPLVEPDTSIIPGQARGLVPTPSAPKPGARQPSGSRHAVSAAPPAPSPRPSIPSPPPPPPASPGDMPMSTLTDGDSGSFDQGSLLPPRTAGPSGDATSLKPSHALGATGETPDSTLSGNAGLQPQQTSPGFDVGVRPTNPFTIFTDSQFRRGLILLGAGVVALVALIFVWFSKLADAEATDPGEVTKIAHAKEAPPKPNPSVMQRTEAPRVVVEQTVDAGHGESRTVLAAAGTVRIVTDPDTNVFVDGKDLGPQPVLVTLPVGKQSVLLRNDKLGFKRTVSVDVVPNELTAVRFAFSMGWIEIDAPEGAKVSIDGKATTGRHIQVWEGTHKVEVAHSDKKHTHAVQSAEVTASMTTSVHFEAPSIADE